LRFLNVANTPVLDLSPVDDLPYLAGRMFIEYEGTPAAARESAGP
jgi:hypothetical protein